MPFCLPQQLADKIKQAIKSGKLNPAKLNNMTSKERRAFLSDIVGTENAKEVNLLFEQKLLLVNQERAMYDWAKQITGMSKEQKEATLQKIRATYAEKKRRVYSPKENEVFLNEIVADVYSKKFRTEITLDEAQKITELTADVARTKEKLGDLSNWQTEEFILTGSKNDALNFGAAKVAMDNYVGGLKTQATKRTWEKWRPINNAIVAFNFIADNSRAIVASVDNSVWGRQGLPVLFRRPSVWAKNFAKSWKDIARTFKGGNKTGDDIINGVKAEIFSRENYMKGRYTIKGERKLDVGVKEEEFPTSLPSKIPVLGRFFRAAEVAYEAGAMRMRVDIVDKIYSLAEKSGIDMTDNFEVGSINELVNSMTGRGRFGKRGAGEGAQAFANKAFFSVKFFKSNWDKLTLHAGSSMSRFARKQAAINLLRQGVGTMIILAIASALNPDSVDPDPRSANFGKIKIGNIRFDTTGGISSLIILIARLLPTKREKEWGQYIKSSISGTFTKLGQGYGVPDGMDMLWNFTENKFSPLFSVIKEVVSQETFEGDKPTVLAELQNLTVPIIIEEGITAAQSEGFATTMLALIAEAIGVSANTYIYNVNWNTSLGKELKQFKEDIGEKEFKKANQRYNDKINKGLLELQKDSEWQKLDNEDKKKEITKMKANIKSDIFKDYRFKYKRKK